MSEFICRMQNIYHKVRHTKLNLLQIHLEGEHIKKNELEPKLGDIIRYCWDLGLSFNGGSTTIIQSTFLGH